MRALVAELHRRHRLLAWAGWVALGFLAFSLAAMALDGRQIHGVSVWTKPAKFAASFIPWFWTLAWAWGVLAPAARRGVLAGLVLWVTLGAAGFEQVWITWRAAAGLPSHFAEDPLGQLMFSLMGLGAALLVAMAALLGLLVLWRGDAGQPRAWRLAVGLGLLVAGVLGGVTGFAMGGAGSPLVGGSGTPGLPPFFWARDGGDLRVAHFLAIHAMQALPGFWLLTRAGAWPVTAASLAWAGLSVAALRLAQAGLPLSP
ncbi:hypothetical protein [Falsiroseomonas tokyonensis]|uniref:Uncharacterized protein n=1 Tax=Falsiroseomonas tokyonensis TaxID=430521 RepID=A0ABV7BPS5_9PROT|nr:hypothetical protein [Falsiroseomonas tokyonensis]MBU8537215.1 hypothetical protein [Falsiroseomonas tokyonensis]